MGAHYRCTHIIVFEYVWTDTYGGQHEEEAIEKVWGVRALFQHVTRSDVAHQKLNSGQLLALKDLRGLPAGFELVEPHRKWLKEGPLHFRGAAAAASAALPPSPGAGTGRQNEGTRHFFLFNDLLLMATLVSIHANGSTKDGAAVGKSPSRKSAILRVASYCGMLQISSNSTVIRDVKVSGGDEVDSFALRICGSGVGLGGVSVKDTSAEWVVRASSAQQAETWEAKLWEAIRGWRRS